MIKSLFLAAALLTSTAAIAATETELNEYAKQNNLTGPADTSPEVTKALLKAFTEKGMPVPDESKVDHFAVYKKDTTVIIVIIDKDQNEAGAIVTTEANFEQLVGAHI